MGNERGWRTETNASDFFNHQKKQGELADRRPVPRKAADIGLGPGMAASAVRITDFNDQLATYNGYYSADLGALNAPNATEKFIGVVTMDSEFGGVQRFIGFESENDYSRVFRRTVGDPNSIAWGGWHAEERIPATAWSLFGQDTVVPSGFTTALKFPAENVFSSVGAEIYEIASSQTQMRLLQAGVYTGCYALEGSVTLDMLQFSRPAGISSASMTESDVVLAGTVWRPFTFAASTSGLLISVNVEQTSGVTVGVELSQFQITRVGAGN